MCVCVCLCVCVCVCECVCTMRVWSYDFLQSIIAPIKKKSDATTFEDHQTIGLAQCCSTCGLWAACGLPTDFEWPSRVSKKFSNLSFVLKN